MSHAAIWKKANRERRRTHKNKLSFRKTISAFSLFCLNRKVEIISKQIGNWNADFNFTISICLTFRNLPLLDQTLDMCMPKECNDVCAIAGKWDGERRNREKKTLWGMQKSSTICDAKENWFEYASLKLQKSAKNV